MKIPDTWQELLDVVLDGAEIYRPESGRLPKDIPAWVRSRRMDLNGAADLLVHEFLQTSCWPQCNQNDLRTLMFLRLWMTAEQLKARRVRRAPDPDKGMGATHLSVYLTSDWYANCYRWADFRFAPPWRGDLPLREN